MTTIITEPIRPEIKVLESTEFYGRFALEPLQRGFGMTLGTPLRRMLLGSLKGAAVTWVKIDGVLHEYASIPAMREGVLAFLQNVKAIRLATHADRPGKMRLEAQGEGEVCAADIIASADFEIVNPELHLAYLDSSEARLSVEFNVETGQGYLPASSEEGLPIGVLPVDAIFTPIRKVSFVVESTRVGQVTDYERLLLELWTDGTITPMAALQEATQVLLTHFFLISNVDKSPESGGPSIEISPEVYNMDLEQLQLTGRTYNALKRHGLNKVGELLEMSRMDLMNIRNFGQKSLDELYGQIDEMGLLPMLPESDQEISEQEEESRETSLDQSVEEES